MPLRKEYSLCGLGTYAHLTGYGNTPAEAHAALLEAIAQQQKQWDDARQELLAKGGV